MAPVKVDVRDIFLKPFIAVDPTHSLQKAIEGNKEEILDLNRQQLDRGLDSEGDSLGKYKNFRYKNRWRPVDLKLEGDFRGEMDLRTDAKGTELYSHDWKMPILEKRYGKDIFGVPTVFISNMQSAIVDDFVNEYSKLII